ncbi:RagB/SusD family nutrient uptake outer membrane protein [Chitinophaga parva]|uniref:RagB/SusD family nutrient uptake outer membrane protein n=1 Tax=Chitinophaga parva TaxID=2169414 RepID=A0A2T7BLK6_9BACT|nr:RagB/SusD family nutrient uptake outer membrane protein [Chitinophaga parva]PUZ28558.1 RagB/SusD family nutrient uptake outer membrane protein [Chitinophaga parva]
MKPAKNWACLIISFAAFGSPSCKKFLSAKTPTQYTSQPSQLKNDSDANAAAVGIYEQLSGTTSGFSSGQRSIAVLCGLYSDELQNFSPAPELLQFYFNSIAPTNSINRSLWSDLYKVIYQCNNLLEGLNNNSSISPSLNSQLQGESLFFRAYFYFYLVNLYGGVPLALSSNYAVNDSLSRSSMNVVYGQIWRDLITAASLLSDDYAGDGERIRANKSAAEALLSRVSLYTGDYSQCISSSSNVISRNNQYQLCTQPSQVFLKNSNEAILQLKPVLPGFNTADAEVFILPRIPMLVALQDGLVNSFDSTDSRKSEWIGAYVSSGQSNYFPFKYRKRTFEGLSEYLMMLRLTELYLNRAEAYAHLGYTDSALRDLNMIRARASLLADSPMGQQDLLRAIYAERRRELFTEWGHRWFDLKRTGMIDSVMTAMRGSAWRPSAQLFPIPATEIALNPHIVQNPGY